MPKAQWYTMDERIGKIIGRWKNHGLESGPIKTKSVFIAAGKSCLGDHPGISARYACYKWEGY